MQQQVRKPARGWWLWVLATALLGVGLQLRHAHMPAGDDAAVTAAAHEIRSAHDYLLLGHPIDINSASAEVFTTLDRIGPALAQRIVEERARAAFRHVDDLTRVTGIGPKTLARVRHHLVVRSNTATNLQNN